MLPSSLVALFWLRLGRSFFPWESIVALLSLGRFWELKQAINGGLLRGSATG
jgi:hypothetical protein